MKTKIIFLFLIGFITALIVSNVYFFKQNTVLRKSIPFLYPGDSVDYFELLDMNGEAISSGRLNGERPVLLFIFEQPCSPCNKNIDLWRKLASLCKEKADVYGIILDRFDNVHGFAADIRLNFPLYAPKDKNKFAERFRIYLRYAQTLLGNLEVEEFREFIDWVSWYSKKT